MTTLIHVGMYQAAKTNDERGNLAPVASYRKANALTGFGYILSGANQAKFCSH